MPLRLCVGCRQEFPQKDLLRLTRIKKSPAVDERVILNLEQKNLGRSVYLCRKKECFAKAVKSKEKNALSYWLRTKISAELLKELELSCK